MSEFAFLRRHDALLNAPDLCHSSPGDRHALGVRLRLVTGVGDLLFQLALKGLRGSQVLWGLPFGAGLDLRGALICSPALVMASKVYMSAWLLSLIDSSCTLVTPFI